MNALTKIYTGARDCPGLAAELEALIRYRWATCLAAHNGSLKANDPAHFRSARPFLRSDVPLSSAAEDARRWLARVHNVIQGDALTILRAVVIEDMSLEMARRQIGRCSVAGAEILLRNAADMLRAM